MSELNRLKHPVGLHLWPGVPGAIAYLVLAAVLSPRGLPNILSLMLAVLLVETPVCWTIIVRQVRRETGGRFSLRAAFPWLDPVPVWVYLVIGVPVIALSVGIMGGLGSTLQPLLIERFFSWVPTWFVMQSDPALLFGLSRPLLLTLWLLSLVSLVAVGAVTQELYFRGFLLPRVAHWGALAPAINAALFAVFHLIAPWGWVVFFLATLPWAYLVWWRRSVRIGVFLHVGVLLVQWLMISLIGLGLIPLPGG